MKATMTMTNRVLFAAAWGLCASLAFAQQPAAAPASAPSDDTKKNEPREITVAVFDIDVTKGVDVEAGALTDQINVMLDGMNKVKIVNRDQLKKVADEHAMNLAGLVDNATAAQLGKFVGAQYVVVGRASKIGASYFLVVKIVDVETTVQHLVSVKAPLDHGIEALIEKIMPEMTHRIADLQRPLLNAQEEAYLARLMELAAPLKDKTILLDIDERHISRPLVDPAAMMAVSHRLQSLGAKVIMPKNPQKGWKDALLENGKYRDQAVDYLLEGEGTSAFAAQIHGLISCRARVELRLIRLPGHGVLVTDRGVDSHVDLVEDMAAKFALEKAAVQACDAVITRWATNGKEKGADSNSPESPG